MTGRELYSCRAFRVYTMLAILAFITVITQPCCLICSAQYQITNFPTTLKDSEQADLLSSWPIVINKRESNHDSDLQNQELATGSKYEPCLEQTEACAVLNRLRRLVASCSRLRSTTSSNRIVCVPFVRRHTTIQSPNIDSNLWHASRKDTPIDQADAANPPEETEDKTVSNFAQTRNLDGFDRLGRRKAFVDQIDWLTPLDSDQSELIVARGISSAPSKLNRWQESAKLRERVYQALQNSINGLCSEELSTGEMSWEKLNNCLTYAVDSSRSEYASLHADARTNSDSRASRLNPYRGFLLAGTAGNSPKRSTEESPLNWTLTKAMRKEMLELDGSSGSAFNSTLQAIRSGSSEPSSQSEIDSQLADRSLLESMKTGATTMATTSISTTENSNIVNNIPLVMPVAEEEALECRMREYTFRAINRDNKGNQCSGLVKATICYGGCDTGEIADWLFPHKKSIHKVCQHGIRVRRKVLLPECNSLIAGRELSVYHYVDARSCKCEICNKANTTCMGSLTAPNL